MDLGPGTHVLVTGASRGIGEAIARAFAARGCTLGLVARSRDGLERLASSLPGQGHRALAADVADAASIAGAVQSFGDVDVLVANAGITHYMPFADLPLERAEQMDRVNWLGTLYTVKAALPGMLERRRGHVVVISSGGGVRGFPHAAVYNGTKAAQRGFAEALRHELHGTGVSVTTVFPGEIETSLHDHELDRMPEWYRLDHRAPAGPLGEKVAEAVERDRREVFYPPVVRLLRIINGVAPRAADVMLRRIMGESVAPRRD
jgi:short-subunit dehydrogenase